MASWTAVLILANVLADVAVGSPLMALPQLLDRLGTDQAAWVTSSVMLAGAIWSPVLARSADIFGKRRVLVSTLLLAGAGALICLAAPNIWVFVVGRLLQGAALGTVFLSVALVLQICTPAVAMTVVGLVTSGSSVVGIVEPFVMQPLIEAFGPDSVFVAAALLAGTAALCVRVVIPESPVRRPGRIDGRGAFLLGGGLAAVLGYVSLGSDSGWLSAGMVALLTTGAVALACWVYFALRTDEPIVDIRALGPTIVLTLVTVALAAGSFRSMLHLTSLVAQVTPERGLGYGLGSGEGLAALLAAPNAGIVVGGTCAGWLAGRAGPALPLLGGIVLGTAATFGMLLGVSHLPLAIVCGALLGIAAGAVAASGFSMTSDADEPERQGTTAGLVSVAMALGSVVVTVLGGEVLKATQSDGPGPPAGTGTGVLLYVVIAGSLFALAAVPAAILVRDRSPLTTRSGRLGRSAA
ncbi:MFS family permease [Mycolicibacterium iranicum]|uniref:MFS family permease n=1 Tax=Mycolicibacterium iranicum TaxID=912594 RepID=A0A839Q631_MYCIR|nr:MFS transporter [Mycolicibacterium iranicum]MBB2989686.1 MFS family permease [Mycolicibacterium iranicum]